MAFANPSLALSMRHLLATPLLALQMQQLLLLLPLFTCISAGSWYVSPKIVTRALASPVQPGICTTRLQRGSSMRLRAWMARGLRQKMGMPPPSDAKSTSVPKGYPARLHSGTADRHKRQQQRHKHTVSVIVCCLMRRQGLKWSLRCAAY
jgi:hypothetical protein